MANLQLVDTYEYGKMYKSSDSNPPYMVYVPNGVNTSTQVHAYMHGAAENNYQVNASINPIIDYLSKNGNDSVVVMYTGVSTVYKEDKAKMLLDVTYDCVNSVGGSTKNITFEGFSDGGVTAFCLTAEHLKKNPDLPPQLVVSYDASALDYKVGKSLSGGLSEEDIAAYLKNGTTILTFEKANHYDASDKPIQYLTSRGIDVVCVMTGQNHQGVNSKTHYDGVYDFLDGKTANLRNAGDYVFQRWKLNSDASDYTDGEWVNLTQAEVSSLISRSMASIILNRYGYLTGLSSIPRVAESVSTNGGILVSDTNYVIDEVNNTRLLISKTSMLKDIGSVEFSSDTKIPVEINSFIGDSLNATGILLEKCNLAMESLVKIGYVFEGLETDASNRVEQLGDTITTNNNDNTNTTSGNSATNYVNGGSGNDTVVSTSISDNSTSEKTNLADTQEEMTRVNSAGEKKISNSNNINSNKNDSTFDSITTNDKQTVYEIDSNTKLVIKNNGETECYYKIDNNDNTNDIIQGFKNNDMVNEVQENNDYLKVVFKKDSFNRDKFNELIESFKVYSI